MRPTTSSNIKTGPTRRAISAGNGAMLARNIAPDNKRGAIKKKPDINSIANLSRPAATSRPNNIFRTRSNKAATTQGTQTNTGL